MLQPHLASSDFERWPFQVIKFVWGCCPSTKFAFLESLSSGFGGFQRPCLRQEPAHGTGRSSDSLCAGEAVGRTREDFPAWVCQVSSGKERAEVDVAHFSKACESAINCSECSRLASLRPWRWKFQNFAKVSASSAMLGSECLGCCSAHLDFCLRQSRLDAPDLSDTSKMSAESRKVPVLSNDAFAWSSQFHERKCSLSWTSCKIAGSPVSRGPDFGCQMPQRTAV